MPCGVHLCPLFCSSLIMKCVNAVDDENICSTYSIEQGWRVAVFLLFVDMSLIPMQTEWKSVSMAPSDRIIQLQECVL